MAINRNKLSSEQKTNTANNILYALNNSPGHIELVLTLTFQADQQLLEARERSVNFVLGGILELGTGFSGDLSLGRGVIGGGGSGLSGGGLGLGLGSLGLDSLGDWGWGLSLGGSLDSGGLSCGRGLSDLGLVDNGGGGGVVDRGGVIHGGGGGLVG